MTNNLTEKQKYIVQEGHQHRSSVRLAGPDFELLERINAMREEVAQLVGDIDIAMQLEGTSAKGHSLVDGARWVEMAREDLQVGFMKLERAVTRPTDW